MNLSIKRTHSKDQDFIKLVKELDAFLSIRNGDRDAFFSQFNTIENLEYAIVVYLDQVPVGCGTFKQYNPETVEIKRMFVSQSHQRKNLGAVILNALEAWAKELGNARYILETGTMLPEAIRFYEKNNYQRIPNYDQYIGVPESVCFEKKLV